jgi:hypothetical protein
MYIYRDYLRYLYIHTHDMERKTLKWLLQLMSFLYNFVGNTSLDWKIEKLYSVHLYVDKSDWRALNIFFAKQFNYQKNFANKSAIKKASSGALNWSQKDERLRGILKREQAWYVVGEWPRQTDKGLFTRKMILILYDTVQHK